MSSGFAGSNTRGMEGFDREVESRLQRKQSSPGDQRLQSKQLDVFTDDFSQPGVSEGGKGQDFRKPTGGYQKPHDDSRPISDPKFTGQGSKKMAPAGDPRMQPEMDAIDQEQQRSQGGIKKPQDQFPGSKLEGKMPYASDAQRGWMHVHEPKIAKEWDKEGGQVKKAEKIDGPESFDKAVEKRMKRLSSVAVVDYKGFRIEVYSDPSLGFMACFGNRDVTAPTKEEAIKKAKAAIDLMLADK